MPFFRWWLLGLAILNLTGLCQAAGAQPESLVRTVRTGLAQTFQAQTGTSPLCLLNEPVYAFSLLAEFYRRRAFEPVWIRESGVSPEGRIFLEVLKNAKDEGLRPEDYHARQLESLFAQVSDLWHRPDPAAAAQTASLEILLSDAYFSYCTHIAVGRITLKVRDGGIFDPRQAIQLEELLIRALSSGRIMEFPRAWSRRHFLYLGLKNALKKYRDLAAGPDWHDIPDRMGPGPGFGPGFGPGEWDQVQGLLVRKKLKALGDISPDLIRDSAAPDEGLQAALKRFQRRHSLMPTGRLEPATLALLNRPLGNVIRQLEVNLERCRWLPLDLGPKYIQVNIPGFQLLVREEDRTVMRMKVVVGKQYQNTPVFASKIQYLVLNPSWIIPAKIMLKEKLPLILKDPEFFNRNHITVISGWGQDSEVIDPQEVDWRTVKRRDYYALYRFRQEPGPWNALGRVKFIMPNPYDVYLHDTPARGLFRETVRNFSHGCIRLEKPLALSEYLLDDDLNWNQARLEQAIGTKQEQRLDLPARVPIYIEYMTAFPGDDGVLYFYPDIYGHDRALESVWEQPVLNPCAPGPQP